MAHRRALAPVRAPSADDLTADLVGIGILVGGEGSRDPNIEDTLVFASVGGMDHGDLRVLSTLVTWFGVHLGRVNADRLTRLVALQESRRVRAFWSALAHWRRADRRFARLGRGYRGPRVDLLPIGTDFQVERHGEDARFARTGLRVPRTRYATGRLTSCHLPSLQEATGPMAGALSSVRPIERTCGRRWSRSRACRLRPWRERRTGRSQRRGR